VDSLTTTQDDAAPAAAPAPAAATKAAMIVRFALAALWTLTIMVLCWMPGYIVQEVEEGSSWFAIPNLDKVVHWGIFVVFAVLWLRTSTSRRRYAWVTLGGLALAVITELVQMIPAINRNAGLDDGITDLIGVALGLAVARWIEPLLSRIESRLLRLLGW
jgi:hypothetical protein